jgi:photosystem II stability/assembly factor-like uncharacterized protein
VSPRGPRHVRGHPELLLSSVGIRFPTVRTRGRHPRIYVWVCLCISCAAIGSTAGAAARSHPPVIARWVPAGIAFSDASHGLAWFTRAVRCSERRCDLLARTDDGGRTWHGLLRLRSVTQVAVAAGTHTVWLVAGRCDYWPRCRPQLLRSDNRGLTWHRLGGALLGLSFPTSRVGFGSLYDAHDNWTLRRSDDGGRTWTVITDPCKQQGPWGMPRVWFTTPREGSVLCGGQPGAGNQLKAVFRSHDGGLTWRLLMTDCWPTPPQCHATPGAGAVGSAGYAAGIAIAGDRGWIWERIVPSAMSADSGRTWTLIALSRAGAEIDDVAPISRQTALILARWAWRRIELRRTDDGGRSWQLVHVWRYG